MIFLSGATSGVGTIVAQRLAERGEQLRCLTRAPKKRGLLPQGAEAVIGDVADAETLARAMEGSSACLHLAHIRFAPRIVEACRRAGVERLICLSSTRRFTRFPCESSRAVIDGESAVESSGLRWTILRTAMMYGGGSDRNVERLVRWFRRCPFFPLARGGRQLVQPVHASDVASAVLAALDRPETAGRAFTLAGPAPLTQRRFVEIAARAAGRRPILVPAPYPVVFLAAWAAEIFAARSGITRDTARRLLEDRAFDISDARRELDFQPRAFDDDTAAH